MTPDCLPPQNLEAERCVLGSMLRDNRTIDDVVHIVGKEDFYTNENQKIFEVIVAAHDRDGRSVDVLILHDALERRGWLADVGGDAYLAELPDAAPSTANVEYYARIVREKSLLRKLILTSNEILGEAHKQTMPADQLVEEAERRIFALAERGVSDDERQAGEVVGEVFGRLDDRTAFASGEGGPSCVLTGFASLDAYLGGLHAGDLVVIAARPSVGKTAVAIGLAHNVAVVQGRGVLFVSLEQPGVELGERLLCSMAGVNTHVLRQGRPNRDEMERLDRAGQALAAAPLAISDDPAQRLLRIAARARRAKRKGKLGLVIIDYLQLIEPENRRDPRQEQVAQMSRGLKRLARQLGVPVVALAQLNRESETRADGRPRLSDLRESGSIEQDADAVLLLHRASPKGEARPPANAPKVTIEVVIAKQRNGPIGTARLCFDCTQQRLLDEDTSAFDD